MLEFMLELWAWGKFFELAFGAVVVVVFAVAILVYLAIHYYKLRKINKNKK